MFFIALILTGCEDFLSVRPSKSSYVVPSTYGDMETILAAMWRSDCVSYNLVFGGGDIDLNAKLEAMSNGKYVVEAVEGATWERDHNGTSKDYMWLYRHQNIFRSNLVLGKINDGAIDATDAELQRLRSAACFRRAYSYMELLNVYTLPYCEANLQELGLIKCEKASFDYTLKRMTLQETYDFVEKDIQEALKFDVNLTERTGVGSPYRVTSPAVNALAARFYLIKQDYANAEKYAKAALSLYGEGNILDYNAIGYSSFSEKSTIVIDGKEVAFEVKYPNTYSGYDVVNQWTENYFTGSAEGTYSSGFSTDFIPSQSLIDCYNADGDCEMDARWKYFYVKNYCYLRGYAIDLPYLMRPNTYSLTVPEMLLTVAECEARVGDYNTAMTYVNRLRAKRIDPAGKVNLTAGNKDEAIAIVLRERRREIGPFMRLFDVRRYNSNDYSADDVTVTQTFYDYSPAGVNYSSAMKTYTLKPGDRKIAAQIPVSDIMSSRGELQQNTY